MFFGYSSHIASCRLDKAGFESSREKEGLFPEVWARLKQISGAHGVHALPPAG
jgi:hypothetical protein